MILDIQTERYWEVFSKQESGGRIKAKKIHLRQTALTGDSESFREHCSKFQDVSCPVELLISL